MTVFATLVYLRAQGSTLMLYRNKKPNDLHEGKYNGLGGKLEKGELPLECAVREVKEESGLTLNSLEYYGQLLFPHFDKQKRDWLVFVYQSFDFQGELIDSPEGRLEWINDQKLLTLSLWEGDKIFLPLLLEQKKFEGIFTYENGHLTQHRLKILPNFGPNH